MALLNPGIGDLGTFVIGSSMTAGSIGNGQEGVIGSLELPTGGIWVITATGWWPGSVTAGYVYLEDRGSTQSGLGTQKYEFSLSSITKVDEKTTIQLKVVNWSGGTVSNVKSSGLLLRAVKVGNV